jgi:ketosteroid isomerase-like protein
MMPPNEAAITGRPRIRSWFDGAPTVSSYDPEIDQVEVRGDLAVVRGDYSITFTPKGAAGPLKDNGKWLEVRQKQADGSWKIAVDIFNSSMPSK